jgi:hypothetical protein
MYNTGGNDAYCMSAGYGWIRSSIVDNVFYNCPRPCTTCGFYTGVRYAVLIQVDNNLVTQTSDAFVFSRNLIYNSNTNPPTYTNVGVQITPGVTCENNLFLYSWNALVVARDSRSIFTFCRVNFNTIYAGVAGQSNGVMQVGSGSKPITSSDTNSFVITNNVIYSNCGGSLSACTSSAIYAYR